MTLHAEPTMPPGLEGFPWANILHMWDYGLGYGRCGTRIKLWYKYDPPWTPQEYHVVSLMQHHMVWDWLGERFYITDMPELELRGNAWRNERRRMLHSEIVEPGQQMYDSLACWGTFIVGARR